MNDFTSFENNELSEDFVRSCIGRNTTLTLPVFHEQWLIKEKPTEVDNNIADDAPLKEKLCELRKGIIKPITENCKNSLDQVKGKEENSNNLATMNQNQILIKCNEETNEKGSIDDFTHVKELLNKNRLLDNSKAGQEKKDLGCTYYNDQILVHANVPQFMLSSLKQTHFTQKINQVVERMNGEDIWPTQSIAWPHLLSGNSLVLINSKRTGRTWCYLPVICTLVERTMKQSCDTHIGPIAIVLVATPIDAHIVHSVCIKLLNSECLAHNGIVVASSDQKNNEICAKLLQGCGILITTQSYLELLLVQNASEKLFDFEYLRHIVIDGLDLLNSFNPSEFQELLGNLLQMCLMNTKQRVIKQQLVVTSQYWDRELLPVLLRSVQHPLLIFGDFLEAIIYGSVNLKIWATKSEERSKVLMELLEERLYKTARTIIFCNTNEEVIELHGLLKTAGYDCLIGINSDEIHKELLLWKSKINKKILICTDQFQALNVQNANHIIHYNLPNCCKRFKLRHSAIVANYRNWLIDLQSTALTQQKVDVLLDECDSAEVPLLIELLLKQKAPIKPNLLLTVKNNQWCSKKRYANVSYTFCPNLAIHGICNLSQCIRRHFLLPIDVPNEVQLNYIPKKGVIEIEVVKVYTPTHYAVRLLSHKLTEEVKWRTKLITFDGMSKDLKYFYANPLNHKRYWPPKKGEICVCKVDEDYQRIRILEVPEKLSIRQENNSIVVGQFLDKITGVFSFKCQYLLVCPEQYELMPPLIIDMRLTAVVPARHEVMWTLNALKNVKFWLYTKGAMHIEASIDCAMTHTIFVSNLFVFQRRPSFSYSICLVNLMEMLLKHKIGTVDENVKLKLNQLFKEVEKLALH